MTTLLKAARCLTCLCCLAMAWPAPLRSQDDAGAELSEDEARQVQVAARFLSILEKNPRRGTALDRVYGHHVEFGSLGPFLDSLKERVKSDPADGSGWMILGLVESLRGEDANAVDAFTHAEQVRTDDPLAAYYLGQSLILVGRPEEGVEAFERAITRKPERADLLEIYQQLGRVHQRAQRDEAARDVWERLEKLFPDDPRVLEQIAVTLTEEGEYAAALERYERLVRLVEDEYRKTTFRMQVAELKIRENRRDEGLADLETLLSDLNPESWLYRDVRRRIEDVFVRSGDQDGMVQYYERWLAAHPQDLDAMARVASFLANAARVPEAMEWMDKALKLAPSRVELRRAFIRQLVDDQRYTEAIQQYALLSAAAPGNVDILREWGRTVLKDPALTEEARRTEAARIWNLIVAAQPDDALTVAQVADLFRQAKFNDEAVALYEKAVALAPDDPQYREYLGEFRHILGQKEEALGVWREIAAGGRRNALNLARLSEVLSRFSYPEEAADTVAQAAALDLKDISLQMQAAKYHTDSARYDDALKYVAVAEGLSQNDEEADAILRQKIETLQAADRLDAQTDELHARLQSNADAPAADWHTLSRYYEAAREWTDATAAIQRALALEPQSISILTSASRIAELSGDFGRAADILRELAAVDRRSRGDHLTNVARIEAQLGRAEQALQAGRDLIVSAPGNTEHYEFYAQLCFRLGKANEGIDSLRKAVRINPTDPDLMATLAAALANDFRTDEAIQLYWQAFEKSEELEDQTGLVMKLTELHLQLNQFDRLIERLERGRREEETRRAMTICIAQAHHASGDYGTARTELESLLSTDTRDTELLLQLSKLCEAGQDFEAAADYQRQVASIAPGPETEYRLAQMLQLHGDNEQAIEILSQLLLREEDPIRMLRGVDSLLNQATFEEALAVIEPLRRDRRDDWELLYREGLAWASLERADEARERFQQLLALQTPIDALGVREEERFNQAQAKAKSEQSRGISAEFPVRPGPLAATSSVDEIRNAVGLEYERYYYGGQSPQVWTPETYGEARLAAYGWLFKYAQNDGLADQFGLDLKAAAAEEAAPRETLIDWLYLQKLQHRYADAFEVLRRLARSGGAEEQTIYLESLPTRGIVDNNMRRSGNDQEQLKPLPEEELDFAVQCLNSLLDRSNLSNDRLGMGPVNSVSAVVAELKRAERTEQAEAILESYAARADSARALGSLVYMCSNSEWPESAIKYLPRWKEAAQRELAHRTGGGGSRATQRSVLAFTQDALPRLMGHLGAEQQNEAVLAIFDDFTEIAIGEALLRRTQRKPRTSRQNSGQASLQIWYGKQTNYIEIDYPRPNDHVDAFTIGALRQVFEVFKRNDVVSDLIDHLDQQCQTATGDDRLYRLLYKSAVQWWQDEQDDAIVSFAEAAECLPQDAGLKMELASLHEARSEFDEALAIVDGIIALDQKLLQTRETLAMHMAERLGDLERARTAAERLFGLRLDTQTQVALASHMRRLGMHDLAAAVVSRADRRAGNQASSLLLLMTQYQGQGNTSLAQQIAFRILQRTQAANQVQSRNPMQRGQTQDSQARDQALRVLAQTGALQPLIEQVEERVRQSPDSPRLYEQLIDYHTAVGNRDRVQELLEQAVAQRPNALVLEFRLAKYLQENGKYDDACTHYLKLIKARPEWFQNEFYEMHNVFQQAQREKELAALMSEIDLRPFGHPYYVMNIAENLIREESTRDIGLQLFERCFDQFPSYRSYVVSNLYDPEMWKNERVYKMGLKGLLPDETTAAGEPWYGVADLSSYDQDGKVNGMFHRLFGGVQGTPRELELRTALEERVAAVPGWHGGKALLALLDIRTGKKDDGIAALQTLLSDESLFKGMPSNTRWMIGQELDQLEQTRDLAIRLFTAAVADRENNNNQIQYSPVVRLVRLYGETGQKERARDLLLDAMKTRPNYGNPEYEAYRMAENGVFAAGELLKMEMPTDAIRIYRDLLLQQDTLQQAGNWYGNQRDHFVQMARQGLDRTLTTLKPENAEAAISELLSPPEKHDSAGPLLDLMLITPSVEALGQQQMQSPLLQLLDSVGSTPSVQAAIASRLQQLAAEYPTDISVAVVQAALQLKRGGEADAGEIQRLLQVLEESPLEPIPEGRRPNSRLRAAAAQRIPVWIIARQCLERPDLQDAGARLADFAITGAERQVEETALAAILFEWGNSAAGRDDLPEAERRWSQLLDFVTRRPQAKPKPEPAAGPMTMRAPWGRGYRRAESMSHINRLSGSAGASPSQNADSLLWPRIQFVAFYDDASEAEANRSETAADPEFIPPLTMPQYSVTMAIAREAAKRKLPALSLRAVREALLGGPPVPMESQNNSGGSGIMLAPVAGGTYSLQQTETNGADQVVSSSLQTVMALWDPLLYPAGDVYNVLAPLVFPPNRPAEILLYEDSSGVDDLRVSSLGASFLEWAQRADKLDVVRQTIAERRESGLAKLPALVLDVRIALLTGDTAAAETALRELDSTLAGNLTQQAVLVGAHAAIPALSHPELVNTAVPVLQRVVEQQIQAIAIEFQKEPSITRLARKINASLHAQGNFDALKKFYEDYLRCTQAFYARYSGEYGLWMQMQIVAQLSADAARNVGPELAMEYLGQAGDVTFREQGPINTGNALTAIASRIRTRSAEDRYTLWRDWTLPDENRRTLRMLTDSSVKVGLPAEFYPLREEADGADLEFLKRYDLLSNFTLLLEAAREANALAELKPRVKEAVDAKLPNADVLWALVLMELEDPEAIPVVSEFAATVYDRYRIPENGRYRQPNVWGDALICLAAVQRPELYDAAQPVIDWLINAEGYVAAGPRSRLLQKVAEIQFEKAGLPATRPRFNHWTQFSPSVFTGGETAWWTVNEGRVVRLTGEYSDVLVLKYPLSGAFEFELERLSSGQNSVDVQFNGTGYTANSDYLSITSVSGHDQAFGQKIGLEQRAGGFERLRIVSDGAQVKYYLADHLLYEEAVNPTSPWLTLNGRFGTAVMRKVTLKGEPQTPAEVPLFAGERMEGWNTTTFGDSQKPFRALAQQVPDDSDEYQYQQQQQQKAEYTWEVTDGELHGRRSEQFPNLSASVSQAVPASGSFALTGRQSWLYYARALAAGERLQYEFFYVPGDTEVHPTLGRLAFILAPDGVHTHWINTDEDRDTYQLDDANSLFETDFQRSGGAVPLRANDWNKVAIRLTDASIAIDLNDAPIFERPIGPTDDTRFGLFRDGNVETRVRAATLSGDWSGKLPAAGDDLMAMSEAIPPAQQRIESTLLASTVPGAMTDYARDILLLARSQPDEQAFETLRNWVLPNDTHGDLRIVSQQAPIAALPPVDGSATPTQEGELLLPAWELVQLAQRLSRLPELTATLDAFPAGRPQDSLLRNAFEVLLGVGAQDDAAARQKLNELREAYIALPVEQSGPRTDFAALAALYAAAERPACGDDVRQFLDAATKPPEKNTGSNERMIAYAGRVPQQSGPDFRELNDSWTNIAAAHLAERELADAAPISSLTQWTLVATDTAPSRGLGLRPTSFRRTDSGLVHMPGQVHSQLLYQSPVTGKFDIVARGTFGPPAPILVGYGMNAVAAIGDPYETLTAQLMRKHEKSSGFPVTELPETSELRISVDGTRVKYSINNSLIREQLLTPQPDPWIAVQAYDPGRRGMLQSLTIEGTPTVPTEIRLLETSQLAGFRTEYFDTVTLDAANEQSAWQYLGEELVGRGFYNIHTPTLQSVLTYHRPLLEDGEFEFEMYYVPGEIVVHPCIGRATFMLNADAPRLHWRTDAQFERSGLASDNEAEIADAKPAPLKEKDWNHIRVALAGDRATLFVNATEVAQIDIREPRERRNFGLFRFANRQKCRVRNLIYRGTWPTMVPAAGEQELGAR